ncbi:hypothetical protein A2160_02665 [Candidatus Beckwithbacteria bacterium RBG_13_42_9]|uniref:Methyltransferase type 12 domain-containing protein n=1 Tax=Candidatus Beckwithbacteria bacterium RBG_13_42_9 TaxID=1797457 RepID=A0A1F5E7I5_9BACT|nr:MAG: hypothetical protein A2160_02665 [Candidatus Beckwithbacteria bacterium RBG_13_42_9]
MVKKDLDKLPHPELIETINLLGPWTHGYFDLGNGLTIEDKDFNQKKRLLFFKNYFIDIITNHYKKKALNNKTLADVGCNTGYFLFELFKQFNFKKVTGLEPRETNLAKARFIAEYFKLPIDRYRLKKFDILAGDQRFPIHDIVIMPSVLHHLDNHLQALRNLYAMTRELCIVDTMVLPNELNSKDIIRKLALTDDIYKKMPKQFGLIGYKLETDLLDGSAYHTGLVGFPTQDALVMMLHDVGFNHVEVYRNNTQLRKEVFKSRLHREMNFVILVATKKKGDEKKKASYNGFIKQVQKEELETFIPLGVIEPLYRFIQGKITKAQLPQNLRWVYESEAYFSQKIGKLAAKKIEKEFAKKKYYSIIKTFKHAPNDKISFEYAKTCYYKGLLKRSEQAAKSIIKTINLDWRTVYKVYYLLALISLRANNRIQAKKYNRLSIRAFASYFPALELQSKLRNS